jgi:chemotaxis protein methyltransferase CheR
VTSVPALEQWEFERLRTVAYREAGIWLSGGKTALLASRLQRRLRELGLTSFSAYHRMVMADAAERQRMLECLTTHETSFFREPRQWEFLEGKVFPGWLKDPSRPPQLRAWSAGCSTGEEPFTIAMALSRHFPNWKLDVLATDLSDRVLSSARAAEWPIARAEQIPASYRRQFMLQNGERMRATPQLRELVRFRQLNLNGVDGAGLGSFDLIFCRNVLIYFDAASKARALQELVSRLAPGGLLLLGHAEAVGNTTDRLRAVVPTIYAASGA